jgi:ABC-type amino acid transport substrate-binding protein
VISICTIVYFNFLVAEDMPRILTQLCAIIFLLLSQTLLAAERPYVCGVSEGFPPFQYKSLQGHAAGFDTEVLKLISLKSGNTFSFLQTHWDNVVSNLVHTENLDCAVGMEITDIRAKLFDFTIPYYYRHTAIFVLTTNTHIKSLADLIGNMVAGDRHSDLEKHLELKAVKSLIRLRQTTSKEESMKLLKSGEVVAVIAPKEVGLYLAQMLNIKVRIIEELKQGSPVGIAVKKGKTQILNILDSTLKDLIQNGDIDHLYRQWFDKDYEGVKP